MGSGYTGFLKLIFFVSTKFVYFLFNAFFCQALILYFVGKSDGNICQIYLFIYFTRSVPSSLLKGRMSVLDSLVSIIIFDDKSRFIFETVCLLMPNGEEFFGG